MLIEANALIVRAEALLNEQSSHVKDTTRGKMMSTATPTQAAALYSAGKSVIEVAQELGITYGRARKLIADSGTSIRNTSDRLKGKTRKSKS